MRKPLFIALLIISNLVTYCQSGKISGTVKDAENKVPLELATVSVLRKDSSMLGYALTDIAGKFIIEKLPANQELLLNVSYTGYTPHFSLIQLSGTKTDTIAVVLNISNRDTNAVIVTSIIPVRMNGDTLEINPNAFKLKGEAALEELLTQVSGMMIWSDGSITMNGRKVENVFVDGKPFFGSTDARTATQNLPKSAIDKIQLYQEYDRSKMGEAKTVNDSLLTMNIQLKENSKKGYFGKISGGYGSRDRFESDLTLQMYNKRNSFGIGGGMNNTNKTIGNLRELFQKNIYRTYNPGLYNAGQFNTMGINKNHSIGGVYTHGFIETQSSSQANSLELSYNKSGSDTYLNTFSLQNRTTLVNPQVIQQNNETNMTNNKHEWSANYVKRSSYSDNLELAGRGSRGNTVSQTENYTEVRDTANQLQNINRVTSSQKQQQNNESLTSTYSLSDADNPLKNFNISLNASHTRTVTDQNTQSIFQSITDITKDTSYNRNYSTNNNLTDYSLRLDYGGMKRLLFGRLNLMGMRIRLVQNLHYNGKTDSIKVADYDSTNKLFKSNAKLSNVNKKQILEYAPTLTATKEVYWYDGKQSKSITFQAGISQDFKKEKNQSTFANRNLDRSFQFFRYNGSATLNASKREKYYSYMSFSYDKNFRYPSVDQLYTIVDDINIYNTTYGNPFLKNETQHTISLYYQYTTQNPKSPYSLSANLNSTFSYTKNPVTDSLINDISGKRFSYFINSDKRKVSYFYSNISIARKIKKSSIQLSHNGNVNKQQLPNYVDTRYNTSNTISFSSRSSLQFSLRTLLIINIEHSLQYSKSKQTATRINSFKNSTNSIKGGMTLNLPNNIVFSSTVEKINNSNLNKSIVLWNSFASYRFMKQQAEFKFSAMDILKQYKNISNSSDAFGTTVRVTNGLQQYFLVTLSYFPRKFGKTTIAKPK